LQDDEKEKVMDDDFFNLLNQNILENDTVRKRPPEEEHLNLEETNFFNLLNQNILENDTVRKRPPEEEHLNLEETNDFADTVGLVNDATMFDAEVTYHMDELQRRTADPLPYAGGHWQGDAALGGDANYEDYNQTFEVDEQHNTSTTPKRGSISSPMK
jgi:hypothetical protein